MYSDLGTAVNARTAHTETGAINGLISAAMTAVDALNQVNSSVQAVSDAHTAVQAAADLIAAATQADTAALTAKLAADAGDALTVIVMFRNSPAGSLEVANAALTHANTLVAGLTSDSTADDARAAYQALADAQVAVRIAEAHPENQIANLNQQLTNVRNQLTDTQTATAAVVAATTALAGLNNDSDESDVQDARTAVDAAQTALDGATNVSAEDMASLQGAIDSLENTLSPIEMAVAARPDPAVVAANTAAAMTKTTAIGMEAGQTPDAGLGGNDGRGPDGQPGGTDDTYSLTIERPRAGTEITIADSMNPADADPATPQFAQAMDLGESNGFARTMHRRVNSEDDDGGSVEEVVIVATDIDPPTATDFGDVYSLDVSTDTENDDPDDTFEALEIDEGDAEVVARVMSTRFTAGTTAVLTFDADDDQTDDDDEAFEGAGTYDGATGTYRCNGATDCTVNVTVDEDEKVTIAEMSAGWIFTPDDDETIDVPDANFLSYGVWLQRTKDEDGVITSYDEVETFTMANGHPETGDSNLADVEGTAIYTGGATGVYVKNVLDDQGNITSATSGQFKAAVTLNASFGGGNVAANDQFTIDGSITGFELEHSEENDWAVALGLTDLSGREAGDEPGESGPGSSHNNVFSGVATGDSTAAAGTYNGTFYGSSAAVDHDMDTDTPDINPRPVAVLGEFNANFTDGTTAGAYGADRE